MRGLKEKAEEIELKLEKLVDKVVTEHFKLPSEEYTDFILNVTTEGRYLHDQTWDFDKIIVEFDESSAAYKLKGRARHIRQATQALLDGIKEVIRTEIMDLSEYDLTPAEIQEFIDAQNKTTEQFYLKYLVSYALYFVSHPTSFSFA